MWLTSTESMNCAFGSENHTTTAVSHRKKLTDGQLLKLAPRSERGMYLFCVATMLNRVMTGINPKISILAWTMNLKPADLPDHLDLILDSRPPDS